MNEELLLPIFGSVILISILILGIFSIKAILFPKVTPQKQEEVEEALKIFIPRINLEKESPKKILEKVDINIKELKEIEMNKNLKEELIYEKLKIDQDIQIKIELLKKEEQKKYFIIYLDLLKKYANNLSNDQIAGVINYIEKNLK
ncbi:hypothetical protein [Cetobacterium sp.]|uniref:hypothetical protein n=1 Tax=Cetobacterium sp. TaxID=2071632 RepID=UPI003F37893C